MAFTFTGSAGQGKKKKQKTKNPNQTNKKTDTLNFKCYDELHLYKSFQLGKTKAATMKLLYKTRDFDTSRKHGNRIHSIKVLKNE